MTDREASIRLLRGRALLRRDHGDVGREYRTAGGVIVPATAHDPRAVRIHRGTVLALGPPGHVRGETSPVLPWDCRVGDVVLYAFGIALERMRAWDDLVVVGQGEIVAVEESGEA